MPRKTRRSSSGNGATRRCFNEAAARCRGKPRGAAREAWFRQDRFNEAAARCRGKPWLMAWTMPTAHQLQ